MTLEERINGLNVATKAIYESNDNGLRGGAGGLVKELLNISLKIINELQQKNDLLQLDLTAAQEIMGCVNQEKEELIKALNYIRSCDNATESAAKAIEMLKKYENV